MHCHLLKPRLVIKLRLNMNEELIVYRNDKLALKEVKVLKISDAFC